MKDRYSPEPKWTSRPANLWAAEPVTDFERKLLAVGGTGVASKDFWAPLAPVSREGALIEEPAESLVMPDDAYLQNVGEEWAKDTKHIRIMVGLALDSDGVWRERSWIRRDGKLLETGGLRKSYFGVELADNAAAWYWVNHVLAPRFPKPNLESVQYLNQHPDVKALLDKYLERKKRPRRNSFSVFYGRPEDRRRNRVRPYRRSMQVVSKA